MKATATATKLKKQLLFTDEDRIRQSLDQANKTLEDFNLFILNAERVLRYKFTPDEKVLLLTHGEDLIKSKVKEWSPFKNSSEDFNLEAMGMLEVKDVYQMFRNKSGAWKTFKFELNEKGFFYLTENDIQKIKDSFTYYTQNDKQNEALTIAENIAKSINTAIDAKLVNEYNVKGIVNISYIVSYLPNQATGRLEVIPNYSYIKSLN